MGSDASSDVTSRGDSGGVPECRLFSEATTKSNYVVKFVNFSRVLPELKKKQTLRTQISPNYIAREKYVSGLDNLDIRKCCLDNKV